MSSRSRTARPLTNQNCRSEVARAAEGEPIQPERRTGPAECASSMARETKSWPTMRAMRAASPPVADNAGASSNVRDPLRRRNATSPRESARRSSSRTMCPCSVTSLRRNFRRAGRL